MLATLRLWQQSMDPYCSIEIQFQTFGNLIHTLMRTCRSFIVTFQIWNKMLATLRLWQQPVDLYCSIEIQFQTFGNLIHTLMRTCRSLLQEKLYQTKQNQKPWKNQKKKKGTHIDDENLPICCQLPQNFTPEQSLYEGR